MQITPHGTVRLTDEASRHRFASPTGTPSWFRSTGRPDTRLPNRPRTPRAPSSTLPELARAPPPMGVRHDQHHRRPGPAGTQRARATAAIVGPGNIGTDLLVKLLRSDVDRGRATWSASIRRPTACAARPRWASRRRAEGVDWLLRPDPTAAICLRGDVGAGAPRQRPALRARPASSPIDLTPAAVGPLVCPPVNCRRAPRRAEHQHDHLRRPGDDPDRARGLAGSRRCPTRRSSRRSRRARRAPAPARTSTSSRETTAARSREVGGARRGKAIIILNPVEPPMIMRDTVFCAIPADADRGRDHARRSTRWSPRCRSTCPATRCAAEPQFDEPRRRTGTATRRVAVLLEVRGNGDYLPPYAGNLDIMTAAAARVGELIAARDHARGSEIAR